MVVPALSGMSRAALFASLLLPGFAGADEQAYFIGLGPGVQTITALRADGLEVVGTQPNRQGYRWTLAGGVQTLECLDPDPPWIVCSEAQPAGVSADGRIVVGRAELVYVGDLDPLVDVAFRQIDGVWTGIGSVEGKSDDQATAISDDGLVVVGWATSDYDFATAFRWTEAEGTTLLGALTTIGVGTDKQVMPHDVSADGSVIVGSSQLCCYNDGEKAFRWTADDGMVGLGVLGANGKSSASGVSADGQVIVGGVTPAGGNPLQDVVAFRWTESSGMELLGNLPGGGLLNTGASAASYDGSAIVGGGTTSTGSEALIWTRQSGFRRLRTLLDTVPGLDLGDWQLTGAVDISDDARTIVGFGTNPQGQREAWLVFLPVPEPDGVALGVAAALGLAILRRRASR